MWTKSINEHPHPVLQSKTWQMQSCTKRFWPSSDTLPLCLHAGGVCYWIPLPFLQKQEAHAPCHVCFYELFKLLTCFFPAHLMGIRLGSGEFKCRFGGLKLFTNWILRTTGCGALCGSELCYLWNLIGPNIPAFGRHRHEWSLGADQMLFSSPVIDHNVIV